MPQPITLPTPRSHALQTTLAPMFGLLAAGGVSPVSWADAQTATSDSVLSLPEIKVEGEATSTFKVDRVTSAKISQPLLDAPQSVTIVPQQVLKEQNAQTLRSRLRQSPSALQRRRSTLPCGRPGSVPPPPRARWLRP